MSAKSTKSRRKEKLAIDRPFDPSILSKAAKAVQEYKIIIEFTDGEYFSQCMEIPGARGDGKTPDSCIAHTRESAVAVAAYMLEKARTCPFPPVRESEPSRSTFDSAPTKRRPSPPMPTDSVSGAWPTTCEPRPSPDLPTRRNIVRGNSRSRR